MGMTLFFGGGHGHHHHDGGGHSHSHTNSNAATTAVVDEHGHSHAAATNGHGIDDEHNINIRAAFIHVLGDHIQSIGVLIADLLILWNVCFYVVKKFAI